MCIVEVLERDEDAVHIKHNASTQPGDAMPYTPKDVLPVVNHNELRTRVF